MKKVILPTSRNRARRERVRALLNRDFAPLIGITVRVHWNLREHLWSIVARTGAARGCVIGYAETVALAKVAFHVSAAGRARSEALRHRTVHAWVNGTVTAINAEHDLSLLMRVTYNPAPDRPKTFVLSNGTPVLWAEHAVFARPSPHAEHGYAWI
ncbi:hypothetical protein GCM10009733_021090 [Nonomuraea maheshkhaliensis]|uniref:Uncharacterized protein n=1 Tax=Nonomuraea maheshkhaliensis TaxID=419590 RepID=A0ABN2F1Z9_9ACTN